MADDFKAHETVVTGELPNDFANTIAESIDLAQEKGLDLDVAVCVAIGVAADYARAEYGDEYLGAMCHVIMSRAGQPLPRSASDVGASSPSGNNTSVTPGASSQSADCTGNRTGGSK